MLRFISALMLLTAFASISSAQFKGRKPRRAEPPNFANEDFGNIFFENVASTLKGERPAKNSTAAAASIAATSTATKSAATNNSLNSEGEWSRLISSATLEDAIKQAKLRLDSIVTTPARFAGGGFAEARREFSLLSGLFAVIEAYPSEVRWKSSAAMARERFSRAAANSKVGSLAAFTEAKARAQELADLMNGTAMSGSAGGEVDWENLIDRGPLMEILEWTFKEHTQNFTASQSAFSQNKEGLQQSAELISMLGTIALKEGMPDATDAEYIQFAKMMIDQAQLISHAIRSDHADSARQAAGQLGQSCVKCHDSYR